jgi:hypothetical protein
MCTTALVLLSLLAQLSPQRADPHAKIKAQTLLTEGSALYEKGDYAGALEKFNAAYAAYPSPKLMFNIGQADRDLSRPVEALEAFEKFLAGAPEASPETRADARKSVAELQEKLGQIRIDCDRAGTEVSIDGKSVGLTPLAGLIWATPGHHQVTASHASAALALENVDVSAGRARTVALRLRPLALPVADEAVPKPEVIPEPEAAPESEAPPPPRASLDLRPSSAPNADGDGGWWLGRKWTWVAAGSTVLLAAGAVTAGLVMQSKFNSLDKSCGSSRGNLSGPACSEGDVAAVRSLEITANVFWGLAGAAAVATGVLFYWEGRHISVSPLAGGTTGIVAAVRY